ncbi:MAG: hypothetical protein QOK05_782 [Chloroflexota bacterium]|nr:hypothetical protein [Chloroflexota bacterium]
MQKVLEDFPINRRRSGGRHGWCLECQRVYTRAHYRAHRAYYLAKARLRNDRQLDRNKELLRVLKDVPCADCQVRYPRWVMEFDHRESDKLFNVSTNLRGRSRAMLLAEVAKCEVVCANCHRDRSFRRILARAAPHRREQLQAEMEAWDVARPEGLEPPAC